MLLSFLSMFAVMAEAPASFHEHDLSDGSSCDQTVRSWDGPNEGVLTSPAYPGSYPANRRCTYSFHSVGNERVQIIFLDFQLFLPAGEQAVLANGSLSRCKGTNDHLTAYVTLGGRMSEIDTFCGAETPPQLMSSRNFLSMEFVAKNSARYRRPGAVYRYKFQYKFVDNFGISDLQHWPEAESGCGFVFNSSLADSGTFYSPNYPGYYPRKTTCYYIFHGEKEEKVRIHFTYFEVEGFSQCEAASQSDYVLFSNYQTEDIANQRYCGAISPLNQDQPIRSESNYYRMIFHSNEIFDATGFYASYQFTRPPKAALKSVKSAAPAHLNICPLLRISVFIALLYSCANAVL